MASMDFSEFKGMQVITQDAYILGEVNDVACDGSWNIEGIKVTTSKTMSKMLNTGSGKSIVLLETGDYAINDVMLLPTDLNSARPSITVDKDDKQSLLLMLGSKVMTSDGLLVGNVEKIIIDNENWTAVSMKIKMDKGAYVPLNIKKGLIGSKVLSGILMTDIAAVTINDITLNLDTEGVKGQVIVD